MLTRTFSAHCGFIPRNRVISCMCSGAKIKFSLPWRWKWSIWEFNRKVDAIVVFSEGRFPEKQVCSANTPRSTVRPPSRQVNFVPPAPLSLFRLLSEAGVDVCFLSCKRWRIDCPDSFIYLPFGSRFPFAGQQFHNRSEIQKEQLNTPKILFSHTAHTGIAWSRGMNARCAENVRVSNRGHRP